MNTRLTDALGLAGALLLASTAAGAAQEIIYACSGADGSISYSNSADGDRCERFAGDVPAAAAGSPHPPVAPGASTSPAPVAVAQPARPAVAAARAAQTQQANAAAEPAPQAAAADLPPMQDRLARYRQAMVMGAQGAPGVPAAATNPAVNRRYHMTDRATYMASRP